MNKIFYFSLIVLALTSVTVNAQPYPASLSGDTYDSSPDSVPTPNQTASITNVKNTINWLTGSTHSLNEDVDSKQYSGADTTWQDFSASNQKAVFAAIGSSADNSNALSLYVASNPLVKINPFSRSFTGFTFFGSGTDTNPFPATFSPFASGTNFQWSLNSIGSNNGTFDSLPSNNADGFDHMMTYHLTELANRSIYLEFTPGVSELYTFNDPYLITWEDVALGNGSTSDEDFNDISFLVDRVAPVAAPEPVSTVLFIVGAAALAMAFWRNKIQIA